MGGPRTNSEELGHIRRLHNSGLTRSEIARKLSRSQAFISSKVKSMHLTSEETVPTVETRNEPSKITAAKIILRSALTGEEKLKTLEAIL